MHYDEKYFEWQRNMGIIGGKVDKFKFEPFITSTDTVIDFGCGGGYILKNLNCKRRIGIEINETARKVAIKENGIEVFANIDLVPDNIADVVISHHALEHTENPFEVIKKLSTKLKKEGKIIFVVPLERKTKYNPEDINMHLYTWSEQNLGNLFKQAGYYVEKVEEIKHTWPIGYERIYRMFGEKVFYFATCIWARMKPHTTQIRVVAHC